MLNMQNVKDIEITEGDVRTIHDKNSRLIWGRLAYDTKYAGDTLQNGTPTPDAPIVVQTVTGAQTVTVSDGIDSEAFSVSLGSIELCKIGNYQDYIYKSGDDWYVHKLIEKLVANGSEEWNRNGNNRQDLEMANAVAGSASNNPVISTRYVSRFSTSANNSVFLSAYHRLCVYDTVHANNTEAWKTWLASNNITFYYALITATDTKITDATLLGQLNAVHEWLTRYGYTSTVTGNLPLIINQTNL